MIYFFGYFWVKVEIVIGVSKKCLVCCLYVLGFFERIHTQYGIRIATMNIGQGIGGEI